MDAPRPITPDIHILPAHAPIPGLGVLAVNAFVIKAKEPVLVDTGMGIEGDEFLRALEAVIDPRDLRWIWLTHDDADHVGNLRAVMAAAPEARLVAHSLAVLRTSTAWAVPLERVHWLNPDESIDAGDRTLTAVRPPLFDNPTTIGIHDDRSGALFSADCFGALLAAPALEVEEIEASALAQGLSGWASLDSPWVHMVEPGAFSRVLATTRRLAPRMILSSHLPVVRGNGERLFDLLAGLPSATPAVAPNQEALRQILGRRQGEN